MIVKVHCLTIDGKYYKENSKKAVEKLAGFDTRETHDCFLSTRSSSHRGKAVQLR